AGPDARHRAARHPRIGVGPRRPAGGRGSRPGSGRARRPLGGVPQRLGSGLVTDEELLRSTLAAVAPGTDLRDGLERILRGRTGALIVLGHDKLMDKSASGGFPLDTGFSAT